MEALPPNWPKDVPYPKDVHDKLFVKDYCVEPTIYAFDSPPLPFRVYYKIFFKKEYGGTQIFYLPDDGDNNAEVPENTDVKSLIQGTDRKFGKASPPPCPRSNPAYPWFDDGTPPCESHEKSIKSGSGKGEDSNGISKRAYECKLCGFKWNQRPPYLRMTAALFLDYVEEYKRKNGGKYPGDCHPKFAPQASIKQEEIKPHPSMIVNLTNYPCMACRKKDKDSSVIAKDCILHNNSNKSRKAYTCTDCLKTFGRSWIKAHKGHIEAHTCKAYRTFTSQDERVSYINQEERKHKLKQQLQSSSGLVQHSPHLVTPPRKQQKQIEVTTICDNSSTITEVRELNGGETLRYDENSKLWLNIPYIPCIPAGDDDIILPVFFNVQMPFKFHGDTTLSPQGMINYWGPMKETYDARRIIHSVIKYTSNRKERRCRILFLLKYDDKKAENKYKHTFGDKQFTSDTPVRWLIFSDTKTEDVRSILIARGM